MPCPTHTNAHVIWLFREGKAAKNHASTLRSDGSVLKYLDEVLAVRLGQKRAWVLNPTLPRDQAYRLAREVAREFVRNGWDFRCSNRIECVCKHCFQLDEDHAGAPCLVKDLKCIFDSTTFEPINPWEM